MSSFQFCLPSAAVKVWTSSCRAVSLSPTMVSVSEPSPLAVSGPSLSVPVVAGSLLREVGV
ncbi:hypothetical protein ACH40D_45640, partial [Streptomyces olivaceoviridis]